MTMADALGDLAKNTLLVVGALFPIVNSIGNTPIFLSLTRGLSSRGRTALAWNIALNSLALIFTSTFIGTHILTFFGISLPVVPVAAHRSRIARETNPKEPSETAKCWPAQHAKRICIILQYQ